MNKSSKRKSIFRVILSRVFVIVIVFNLFLAGINIFETIRIQKENDAIRISKIKEEIVNIKDYLKSSIKTLEKDFYNTQLEVMSELILLAESKDLKELDLNEIILELELDSAYHDLYVIEEGTIVNTTFSPDLGMNFYEFGKDYEEFQKNLIDFGGFFPERFAFEYLTRNLRFYSYQATKDKKYLIEIGSYSRIANEILGMFKNRLREIVKSNEEIVSVNFWFGYVDNYVSLIEDSLIIDQQDSILNQVFSNQENIEVIVHQGNRKLLTEYLFIRPGGSLSLIPEFTISIVTDITDRNKPIFAILVKQFLITMFFLFAVLLVIVVATKRLNLVFHELLKKIERIANGELHERVTVTGSYEFTTIAEKFNTMVNKLEVSYKELKNQKEETEIQKNKAVSQMKIVKKQKDELLSSINYAQRIQNAVLPTPEMINDVLPNHFVINMPRDIVSGDFYWMERIKNYVVFVVADCTGHGVPGAFMSMFGISFLNEIVTTTRFDKAGEILNRLRNKVKKSLRQTGDKYEQKDGMDLALCVLDLERHKLEFAGAYNPIIIIRNNEIIEYKGDPQPIAIYVNEKDFTSHSIDLQKDDVLYMFTDGYVDQIGGERNKKFLIKNLRKVLLTINEKPMEEQKKILEENIQNYMKGYEQLDDILLVGFRII
jgi:phosphoserine phosphatase RsbU/P